MENEREDDQSQLPLSGKQLLHPRSSDAILLTEDPLFLPDDDRSLLPPFLIRLIRSNREKTRKSGSPGDSSFNIPYNNETDSKAGLETMGSLGRETSCSVLNRDDGKENYAHIHTHTHT